jgi:hypothetical protein
MRKRAASFACWVWHLGQHQNAARLSLAALFDPEAEPANLDAAFGTLQQSKKWDDDWSAKEPACRILKNF